MRVNTHQSSADWLMPRFYLVSERGKGQYWVQAIGAERAKWVFRRIPAQSERGAEIYVEPIRRGFLGEGCEYWVRLGDTVQRRWYCEPDRHFVTDLRCTLPENH